MLKENTVKKFKESSKNKIIAVIGAGRTGKKFISEFLNIYGDMIVVCDNSVEKQGKELNISGHKYTIFSIDVLSKFTSDQMLIVITCSQYAEVYKQIMNELDSSYKVFVYPFIIERSEQFKGQIKQCLSDYYYFNHMDLNSRDEYVLSEYNKIEKAKRNVVPYLPVYLTTRCTLNCEKCNNLMPYFKAAKTNSDFNSRRIIESLEILLNCVDELLFCELVGGEPFLYDDFKEILQYVGENKKIRQIVVVTNGTLIPAENILSLLKKYNVLVRISDYGMFENISKLVVALEKWDINVRVLQDMKWNDPGGMEKRNRTKEELYFQYNKCIFSLRCKYLTENKLYTCARIASLALLGEKIDSSDVLDIDENLTTGKLMQFYLNNEGAGCDYCDLCSIDAGFEIPAAVQSGSWQIKHSEYTIIRNDYLERLKRGK